MSATDTQVLAALNAWYAIQHPHTIPADSLAPYADENILAMTRALDAANLDSDRLRDRIKAMIDEWQEATKLPNVVDTLSGLIDSMNRDIVAVTRTEHANTLRALLDGEAKG